MNVTFALPGDHRSGGVRVTVIMANQLIKKGINCRIAIPARRRSASALAKKLWASATGRTGQNAGWMHLFDGKVENYQSLDDLEYSEAEIVIAVGTYMVEDVRRMKKPVQKVRFNHGMPTSPKPEYANAWRGSLPTITVSNTLVPRLEAESGEKVLAVVPNGIDREQYYPRQDVVRDGIGAVFNPHQNKAPKDMIRLLQLAHQRWPNIPQYVFSTEERPEGLEHTTYTRYPSVDEACRIYNQAKCWLMTSKTEGLPGVALEAMSCGCVMVSSDNDGSLEIIQHDKNGLIAHQPNLEEYLNHIDRVCSDDSERKRLSEGAIELANSMTWERAADKMITFLSEVLPRHSPESSMGK